jgi:protein SCO1/2
MNKFLKINIYAVLLVFMFVAAMTGCSKQASVKKFQATDITGVDFGKDFQLTDHTGKHRTLADFRGKAVVMFFGYTHCPDVCPTTMSDMAQALKLLGKDAEKVQVLFVTIDPARDTPELLAQYVPAFDPGFLGLYGDDAATAKVAKDFRIFYQKHQSANSKTYEMDHTAGTYVFDQSGNLRLFMSYGQGAESIAQDLRALLVN